MDKKSKIVIKEVIDTLWNDRQKLIDKNKKISFKLQNNRAFTENENIAF